MSQFKGRIGSEARNEAWKDDDLAIVSELWSFPAPDEQCDQ